METGESYRQFFEHLVGHARQHSSPAGSAVDNTMVPGDGDTMTVSHLNMIALWWMRKIHVDLNSVVRTEYAVELRNNKPLASLVPRISANVDSLLQRYDKSPAGAVNMVKNNTESLNQTSVLRVRNNNIKSNPANNKKSRKEFCPGCFYLGEQMDATIHYQHRPGQCPRKPALVKMLQLEDLSLAEEDSNDDDGKKLVPDNTSPRSHFQANKVIPEAQDSKHSCTVSKCNLVSSFIRKIERNKSSNVSKSPSPSLWISTLDNKTFTSAVIDEGAEICAIDKLFALKSGIKFEKSSCNAVAALVKQSRLADREVEGAIAENDGHIPLALAESTRT